MNEDTSREDGAGSTRGPSDSELRQQVAEFSAQRLAISEVLRAIVWSPYELQPVLQTVVDSAIHLCRAAGGAMRLVEEAGFRLVALKLSPLLAEYAPPVLVEHGSFPRGFFPSKWLVADFAAQAAIALEITAAERRLRELQMQLAHANRVITMGQLRASITHEVTQPIASTHNNIIAALHFLDRDHPDLQEVREALACTVKDIDRANAIVNQMCALMQKTSPRPDRVDMNAALQEVIDLTRGEALKSGVSLKTQFAKDRPFITGDRVQLQQVVLNLILNALQAMGAATGGAREVLVSTRQTDSNALYVGIQDTGPGLSPETLSRLFEPF